MNKIAWNIDANSIGLNDIDTKDLDNQIVTTRDIEKFLRSDNRNKKLFVVAPKGLGKTLVLKIKSQMLRNNASGYEFIPRDRLCERFGNVGSSFSYNDIQKFNNREIWTKVWELSIYTLILRRFNYDIPNQILNVIGYAGDLQEILAAFVQNRSEINRLFHWVPTFLKPAVRDLKNQGINQVAIFIDNIDEGFEEHTGYSLKNPEKGSSSLSERIWINAQLSILNVARDICSNFKHIKIFLSIRSEAYNNNSDSTKLQLDDLSVFLRYSKEDLEQIFIQNIKATNKSDLCESNSINPLEKLTGYLYLNHPIATNENGDFQEERLLDFIFRHTFMRPREIVLMGHRIINHLSPNERTPRKIRALVNDIGYELFSQLKNEIIPFFQDEVVRAFCRKLKSNVITYERALDIFKEIRDEHNFDNVFSYMYNLGLIGVVESDHNGNRIQKFLPVGQYSLSTQLIPEYKYFVLHPTLYSEMKKIHENSFLDPANIVGYDYPFFPNRSHLKRKHHLHFGLDRDSLSLVIPEFYKTKCLAIVQEPNQDWVKLNSYNRFMIQVNDREFYSFTILRDNHSEEFKTEILHQWKKEFTPILIYSKDTSLIQRVFDQSETCTFCIPDQDLIKRIKSSPSNAKVIYFCQRTIYPAKWRRIKKNLQKNGIGDKIKPFLIDRFTYSSDLIEKDENLICKVNAETYGIVIYPDRPESTMAPSRIVLRTKSKSEFDFYKLGQHYLVEGIYQFYKYLKQQRRINLYEDATDLFNLFFHIQINRLLNKCNSKTIEYIHGGKSENEILSALFSFCENVANRIDDLDKRYSIISSISALKKLKNGSVFPNDADFYRYVLSSEHYQNYDLILELKSLLEVKGRTDYYSVFISYSFRDSEFVKRLNKQILVSGVDSYLFEINDSPSSLKNIMFNEVHKYDKLLFIASENSLKSEACHFELTQYRLKYEKSWTRDLISIRIDDYIFRIQEFDIPMKYREEFWQNILLIRENNIPYYTSHVSNDDMDSLRNKVNSLINDCLRIEKQT